MARQLGTVAYTSGGRPLTPPPQESLAEKVWGGLSKVVGAVEQPFVSLAAKPVQLAAKALGSKDPYSEGIPAGLPGADTSVPVSPPTLKGTAGDLLKAGATAGGIVSAPASLPAALATGAAVGAGTMAGTALQEDKPAAEVAKQGLIGGLVGGATAGAVRGIGKLIEAVGGKILNSVIKPTKPDLDDGFSMNTIKEYNLGGSLDTIKTKTQTKLTELTNNLNSKLADSPNRIDLNKVYQQTVSELTDESKLRGFGANVKIGNTLEQLKEEIGIVAQEGGNSIPDAQIIKQASGGFGAWQYGKADPDSKATEIIYNTFYSKLKKAIEDASPEGVRSINQELAKLIPVMNAVIRRIPIEQRSGAISLNEMIGLVGSSVNPIALGPTLLAILSRSGAAGNVLANIGEPIARQAIPASLVTSSLAEQITDTEK